MPCCNFFIYDVAPSKFRAAAQIQLKAGSSLNYLDGLNGIRGRSFDLIVHSATANDRIVSLKRVFNEMGIRCELLLLEKIPFSRASDWLEFIPVSRFCKRVFVNYPRALYEGYQRLKEEILKVVPSANGVFINVEGRDWNLLSNSLHYVHLADFLFGCGVPSYHFENIEFRDSRHVGYADANGRVRVEFHLGEIHLVSRSDSPKSVPLVSMTLNDGLYIEIDEELGLYRLTDRGVVKEAALSTFLQSELTSKLFHEPSPLQVNLPSLLDSCRIDLPYLTEFEKISDGRIIT